MITEKTFSNTYVGKQLILNTFTIISLAQVVKIFTDE